MKLTQHHLSVRTAAKGILDFPSAKIERHFQAILDRLTQCAESNGTKVRIDRGKDLDQLPGTTRGSGIVLLHAHVHLPYTPQAYSTFKNCFERLARKYNSLNYTTPKGQQWVLDIEYDPDDWPNPRSSKWRERSTNPPPDQFSIDLMYYTS
jgi:hypothetical protein